MGKNYHKKIVKKRKSGWKKKPSDEEKFYRLIFRTLILVIGSIYFYKNILPKIQYNYSTGILFTTSVFNLAVIIETIFFLFFIVALFVIVEIAIYRQN